MADRLYAIASQQQGFFAARQAKEAGYSDSRFSHHVRSGAWVREGRGIYRLAHYPQGERPDLVYWSLWSCNLSGKPQGIFSHDTALAIHDLSDLMPAKYHLTVPPSFRRYHAPPENLLLHRAKLDPEECWAFEGYRVTAPVRTLIDVIEEGRLAEDLVVQAIADALDRGLITRQELAAMRELLKFPRAQRIFADLEGS